MHQIILTNLYHSTLIRYFDHFHLLLICIYFQKHHYIKHLFHSLYGGYEIDALCNDAFGNIYISTAGGSGQSIVLKWNGTNWSKLFDASVTYAICSDISGNVYATFNAMAAVPQISNVDKWNGSALSVLGGN